MRALTTTELLDAWDAGADASPAERCLALVGLATGQPRDAIAARSLGWMAVQLLALRAGLFGPSLSCLATCGRCGTVVEMDVAIADLTSPFQSLGVAEEPLQLEFDGYCIGYRLPSCRDLLSLQGDPVSASRALATSLVEYALLHGEATDADALPLELHSELARSVVEHDPLAHIELVIQCSACGFDWLETLNVMDFVWQEVAAHARRLTAEVVRLASAFGWREADILGMSERRRRRYLEMLPA